MKKFFYLLGIASLLLTGCYKDEINELQKEMDDLENIEIASLQDQVKKVTASIGTLEGLSSELKEYINKLTAASAALKGDIDAVNQKLVQVETTLQAEIDNNKAEIINRLESAKSSLERQLADVNTVLSNLEEKSAALEQRIADLKTYADNTYADKTWVEGTFATLEAQNALIEDIEVVKANILTLTSSIAQIEANVRTMVGEKLAELTTSLEGQLQEAVLQVTEGYTAAITAAKDEVTSAYTSEIASKISDSETGIKSWITDQLKAYYTVSAAEAQIAVFQALLGNVPQGKSLQEEIDQLIVDFGTTKESIIETYKQIISEKIEDKASELSSALQEKVKELNTTISGLQSNYSELAGKVSDLLDRMGTLEGEMDAAQAELKRLEGLLTELQTSFSSFIEGYSGTNLATIVAELQKKIEGCATEIAINTANISELTKTITTLQENIQTLLGLETQLSTAQTNIASLQAFINGYGEGKDFTTLSALVTYLEGLIEKCAKASDLDELEAIVGDANSGLVKQVADLNTSLTNINSAIDAIKTFIGTQESGATLASLLAALQTKIDECLNKETTISGDITALLERIEVIEGYAEEIEDLGERITEAESDIESIEEFLEGKPEGTLKTLLEGIKAQIDDLKEAGKTAQDNIQEMIDAITAILYGTGSAENPAAGSLMYRITQLENQLVAKSFQSIAYVPTLSDGSVQFGKVDNNYEGNFIFLVRPASIAGFLNNNNSKLRWISTPETKADYGTAFDSQTVSGDAATGQITISATILGTNTEALAKFDEGVSAALFVNIAAEGSTPAVEFTSKFIPITMPSDKIEIDKSSLVYEFTGGSQEVNITKGGGPGPGLKKLESYDLPEWITMQQGGPGNERKFTFTAAANTGAERVGTIILRFKKHETVVILVRQKAFVQTLTPIKCDGTEMTEGADGKRRMTFTPAGSTQVITVTPSDEQTNWTVVKNGVEEWLTVTETVSENKISVTAAQKDIPGDRVTEFIIKSSTGVTYPILVTQTSVNQTLAFDPAAETGIELNWKGEEEKVSVTVTPEGSGNNWTVKEKDEHSNWIKWEKIETESEAYVNISADPNKSANEKSGVLVFTSNTGTSYEYPVKQAAFSQTIEFDPESVTLSWYQHKQESKNEVSVTVTVDPEEEWNFSIPKENDWLQVEKVREGKLIIKAKKSNDASPYQDWEDNITVTTNSGGKGSLKVTQKAFSQTFTSIKFEGDEMDVKTESEKTWREAQILGKDTDDKTIKVTTSDNKKNWTVDKTGTADWLNIDERYISSYGNLYINAKNKYTTPDSSRSTEFTLKSSTGIKYIIKVIQINPKPSISSITPKEILINADGDHYYDTNTKSWEYSSTGGWGGYEYLLDVEVEQLDKGSGWTIKSASDTFWSKTGGTGAGSKPSKDESSLRVYNANANTSSTWQENKPTGTIVLQSEDTGQEDQVITITQNRPIVLEKDGDTKTKIKGTDYYKYKVNFDGQNWQITNLGKKISIKGPNQEDISNNTNYSHTSIYIYSNDDDSKNSITFLTEDSSARKYRVKKNGTLSIAND